MTRIHSAPDSDRCNSDEYGTRIRETTEVLINRLQKARRCHEARKKELYKDPTNSET
jgi:hypothetical protein